MNSRMDTTATAGLPQPQHAQTATLPRVLFITHRVPYPPNRGDRIRTYHVLKFLSRRAVVDLACLADEPVSTETREELASLCRQVAIEPVPRRARWLRAGLSLATGGSISEGAFRVPSLGRAIRQWSTDTPYQAVLASSSALGPYLAAREFAGSRRVVDLIDVDSQKWVEYAARGSVWSRWLYATEARRVRALECRLARQCDGIVVISQAEAELFRSFAATSAPHAIPNGVDLEYFRPVADASATQAQRVVFVGVMDYKPNVEGICWFVERVWPRIRDAYPHSTLQIVGRQPAEEVQALARVAGVEVVGAVPDVRPYLTGAAAVIAPLQIARGVQNKVLEALAMGRPVVACRDPLVGLGLTVGNEVLQADTPETFAGEVGRLFDDSALRARLGRAGRSFVEAHHAWEKCLEPLVPLLGLTP